MASVLIKSSRLKPFVFRSSRPAMRVVGEDGRHTEMERKLKEPSLQAKRLSDQQRKVYL